MTIVDPNSLLIGSLKKTLDLFKWVLPHALQFLSRYLQGRLHHCSASIIDYYLFLSWEKIKCLTTVFVPSNSCHPLVAYTWFHLKSLQ